MKRFLKSLLVIDLALAVIVGLMSLDEADAETVKLNKSKATIFVEKTEVLTVTGTKRNVTWKTSDKSIATVTSKGKITAKKVGTVTITAKVSGKKYSCKVTVKNPYLNITKSSLAVGRATNLKLTGAAAKSFSSKNTKIATVSQSGKVTAKRNGTTKIIVKDTKGRTYQCNVNVKCVEHKLKTTTIIEATCQQEGVSRQSCSTCDYDVETPISKIKHQYVFSHATTTSCYKQGVAYFVCKWCDAEDHQSYGHAGQNNKPYGMNVTHLYGFDKTVAANKKGLGYDLYTCYVCKKAEYRNWTDYCPTATQVYKDIISKKKVYPEGAKWNSKNYYDWNAGYFNGGYGCSGFAFMLSDAAFGYLPAKMHYDFENIKAGDIVRLFDNTHSVVILKFDGDKYTVAEGNYNGKVHWNGTMTKKEIQKNGTYVITRYPDEKK